MILKTDKDGNYIWNNEKGLKLARDRKNPCESSFTDSQGLTMKCHLETDHSGLHINYYFPGWDWETEEEDER
jgi:hypothetical protein